MHETVEQGFLLPCLPARTPHGHERARQDLQVIGATARRGRARLHIFIELPGFLDCSAAAEYDFRGFGGELPTRVGCTGLHDDRPALDRSSDVQRTTHRQMIALVIEDVHFLRIEEDAACLVVQPCVVGPTVPQTRDDRVELARPPVAFVVLHMVGQAEIQRRVGIGGRHDIPPRSAVADVVERGEPTRDMVGFVERCRCGRDEANPFRDHRERRKQRHRFERRHGRAAPQRRDRHIQNGQVVRHEKRIEARLFQRLDETHQVLQVEVGVGVRTRIAPPRRMDGYRTHDGAEMKLLRHGERSLCKHTPHHPLYQAKARSPREADVPCARPHSYITAMEKIPPLPLREGAGGGVISYEYCVQSPPPAPLPQGKGENFLHCGDV